MFTVTEKSHVDHHVPQKLLLWVQNQTAELEGFFIRTLDIPAGFEALPCQLRGPLVGDGPIPELEVRYEVRKGRTCASRIAVGCKPTSSRLVTVIAGPGGEGELVLYTVYGGPCAPREPGDTSIPTFEGVKEARDFWAIHALAEEGL